MQLPVLANVAAVKVGSAKLTLRVRDTVRSNHLASLWIWLDRKKKHYKLNAVYLRPYQSFRQILRLNENNIRLKKYQNDAFEVSA